MCVDAVDLLLLVHSAVCWRNYLLVLHMAHDNYITGRPPVRLIQFRLPPQTPPSRKSGSPQLGDTQTVFLQANSLCLFIYKKITSTS